MLNALSAISLAASITSALAASPAPSARPTNAFPPIGVTVISGRHVPPALVLRILAETDAIWRGTGFTFVWQRESGLPTMLRVTIDDERNAPVDGNRALGWIHFDERNVPEPQIHLSYADAVDLMSASQGVVGVVSMMPPAQRFTLLGRAMGRALAHEMGHYLLASKAHTRKGLMGTARSASDLFSPDRAHFQIDDAQRAIVAARLAEPAVNASNRPTRSAR
jgi:hypothetical protein